MSQVVQIGARTQRFGAVLEQLFHHAWSRGAVALEGRMEPRLARVLSERHCFFHDRDAQTHREALTKLEALRLATPSEIHDFLADMVKAVAENRLDPQQAYAIGWLLQQLRDGADFSALAMDYSEDPVSAASGGDLGFIPESALTQTDAALRRMVAAMTPGQISDTVRLPDGYRILRLVAKEVPGQRELASPQVQQSIRDTLRSRKEQLMRAAYLLAARDQTRIVNYLARQVLESAGKLPEIKVLPPAAAAPAPAPAAPPAPAPTAAPAAPPAAPSQP